MTLHTPSSPSEVATFVPAACGGETCSAASLLTFFALAFAWSWTCWMIAPALKVDYPDASITLSLTGGFGPSVSALVVVACGSGGAGLRRWLRRCMRWRGGWRVASLLLGAVWAVWHLPLFYSPGTVQSHLPMGLYALSAIASSVLFAWLFNRGQGSVVPVLVLHTAVNAWSLIIPVMVLPDGSNLRPFQIVVGILVLTAIVLLCSGEPVLKGIVKPGVPASPG